MPRALTLLDIAHDLGIDGTGRLELWQERVEADQASIEEVRIAVSRGYSQSADENHAQKLDPDEWPEADHGQHAWNRVRGQSITDRVESHLEQIEVHSDLNAFTRVYARESLEDAHRLDSSLARGESLGPLAGAIVAVKDVMQMRGVAPSGGTSALQLPIGNEATVVSRLRSAGVIIIGAANLHALAYGPFSTSSDYGAVANPRNRRVVAGGSSGGSVVAVAAGLVDLAIGTDTAGSIRMPAALCGIVGLKPTFGTISPYGCHPLAKTLDHIGPLARTIADTRAALAAMVDSGFPRISAPAASEGTPHVSHLKVGVPQTYIDRLVSPVVRQAFNTALERLDRLGAEIVPVSISRLELAPALSLCTLGLEALSTFRQLLARSAAQLPSDVRLRLEAGMFISASDYLDAQELPGGAAPGN